MSPNRSATKSVSVQVTPTKLHEVTLVTPRVFADNRGFFVESFNERDFAVAGIASRFVQDNHSRSKKGVVRGLHYQLVQTQGKLVTVIRGRIFDVAADIRKGSPTFGSWVGVTLDDISRQSLWIPSGFAHGFCALSDEVDVVYKCTDYYSPAAERGIMWNDPILAIDWPIHDPLVSSKDQEYPPLSPSAEDLPQYRDEMTLLELRKPFGGHLLYGK